MRYLYCENGQLEARDDERPASLAGLQSLVDGLICSAFSVPSPVRDGYVIGGLVNDEGLLIGMAPNVVFAAPECGLVYDYALVGPLIITGVDPEGATAELTEDEARHFAIVADPLMCRFPILLFSMRALEGAGREQ